MLKATYLLRMFALAMSVFPSTTCVRCVAFFVLLVMPLVVVVMASPGGGDGRPAQEGQQLLKLRTVSPSSNPIRMDQTGNVVLGKPNGGPIQFHATKTNVIGGAFTIENDALHIQATPFSTPPASGMQVAKANACVPAPPICTAASKEERRLLWDGAAFRCSCATGPSGETGMVEACTGGAGRRRRDVLATPAWAGVDEMCDMDKGKRRRRRRLAQEQPYAALTGTKFPAVALTANGTVGVLASLPPHTLHLTTNGGAVRVTAAKTQVTGNVYVSADTSEHVVASSQCHTTKPPPTTCLPPGGRSIVRGAGGWTCRCAIGWMGTACTTPAPSPPMPPSAPPPGMPIPAGAATVSTFAELKAILHEQATGASDVYLISDIVFPTDGTVPSGGIRITRPVRLVGACLSTSLVVAGTVAAGTCKLDANELSQHFTVVTQDSTAEVVFEKLALVRGKIYGGSGGSLSISAAGPTRYENIIFMDNDAGIDWGGAVYLNGSGKATFTSCRFLDNKASLYGGAVSVRNLLTTFTQCTFEGNYNMMGPDYGHNVHVWESSALFFACTFIDYLSDPNKGVRKCDSAICAGYTSFAIYDHIASPPPPGMLVPASAATVSTFAELKTLLHQQSTGASDVYVINDIVFPTDGTAPMYGIEITRPVRLVGACAWTSLVVSGTVAAGTCKLDARVQGRHFWVKTTQYSTAEVVFEKLALKNGGKQTISLHGASVEISQAGLTKFQDVLFLHNKAYVGGAVEGSQSGKATFSSCRFLSNGASTDGGAIFMFQIESSFTSCFFEDNEGALGGAVRLSSGSSSTFTSCMFQGNVAGSGLGNGHNVWVGGDAMSGSSSALFFASTFVDYLSDPNKGVRKTDDAYSSFAINDQLASPPPPPPPPPSPPPLPPPPPPSPPPSPSPPPFAPGTATACTFAELKAILHDQASGPSTVYVTCDIDFPTDGSVPSGGIILKYPVRIVGACSSTSLVVSGTVTAGTCKLDAKEVDRHFDVKTTQYSTAEVVFEKLALVNGSHPNNGAPNGMGGAVLASYTGATRFEEVIFMNNTATNVGGAVKASFSGKMTFSSCRFLGNEAEVRPFIYSFVEIFLPVEAKEFFRLTTNIDIDRVASICLCFK